MPARLTLISHAPTEALRSASFPLDEPLSEGEPEKISALHWTPPRTQQIISAPELRARQTAHALGLSAEAVPELRDCDYGSWSGFTFSDIASLKAEEVTLWLADVAAAPHGGESIFQLIARVRRWVDAQRGTGHTLAITHPAIIRAALVSVFDAPPQMFWHVDIAPLSMTDLRWNERTWTVRCSGCSLVRDTTDGISRP